MQFVLTPSFAALTFWSVTAAWLLEPLVFPSVGGSGIDVRGRRERLGIAGAILLGFGLTAVCHHFGWGNLTGAPATVLHTSGLCLYTIGVLLRYTAACSLGSAFTRDVHVEPDRELASRGPYRLLRHPLYVGLFALSLGLLFLFANIPGPLVSAPAIALAIGNRARREERMLRARRVPDYDAWSRKRYRFVPGLF